jgi:4-hydroxymandelate oxidase
MTAPQVPPGVAAVADYEPLARERLDPAAWAYLDGAAGDETTHRANRAAWAAQPQQVRVLRDLLGADTSIELFGRRHEHPVFVGPVAYQRLFHPDGEVATALAAEAQGAVFVLSTLASIPVETLARACQGPRWFQLYWQADPAHTRDLVQRAEANGCEALVLTVDAPVHGARDRERRAGFRLPTGVQAAHLARYGTPAGAGLTPQGAVFAGGLMQAAPTWRDIDTLRGWTRLPLLLKGIGHPDDACEALQHGVDGLVVSNHGGRCLDGQAATATLLPAVVAAVAGRVPVLVDGGIRRGTDVLAALRLGAQAVLLGRAPMYALAAAGPIGVAHVLRLLRDELEIAMALSGRARLTTPA